MRRQRVARAAFSFFIIFVSTSFTAHARALAQIRPIDPPMYRAFDGNNNILLTAGLSVLNDQRASLAGTRGRYHELGMYGITWRTGRVSLGASGTAFLRMSGEKQVEAPLSGIDSAHQDAGPVIVETAARLTPDNAPVLWLLRFGTQLPVTSFRSGLERDEADFFATLALRTQKTLWFAAEAGAAINGRPEPFLGQNDVLMFSAGTGYRGDKLPVILEAWFVGHDDLHDARVRGNEDLRELRLGARTRGRFWIGAQLIHGFSDFSPSDGVRITAGIDAHLDRVPVLGWH